MRTTVSIVMLCAAWLVAWQDPSPQDPAKPEATKPAVAQPSAEQVDSGQQTEPQASRRASSAPKRHRYEGVYRLREVMVGGRPEADDKRGYLAITGRHLFLVVAADSPDPDRPVVSAGVRRWQDEPGGIGTTVELDFFTDHTGELHFTVPGLPEVRGIELVRGGLRVVKDATTWMDFERIE